MLREGHVSVKAPYLKKINEPGSHKDRSRIKRKVSDNLEKLNSFQSTTQNGVLLNEFSISGNGDKRSIDVSVKYMHPSSHQYYTAGEKLARDIQWGIDKATKSGPVKITEGNETVNLEGQDQRRSLALMLARKYSKHDETLRGIAWHGKKHKLTDKQIDAVFNIVSMVKHILAKKFEAIGEHIKNRKKNDKEN